MKFIGYSIVGGLVIVALGFGVYMLQLGKVVSLEQPVEVYIEDGSGTEGAANALHEAGVLPSRWAFYVHAFTTGQRTELKSGTFVFEGEITIQSVIDVVTQSKQYREEVEVTLVEGWTNQQYAEALSEAELVEFEDFLAAANTANTKQILPDNTYSFLAGKPASAGLIGFLFPDTYRFFRGETEVAIIEEMLDNFDRKITDQMLADAEASGRTLYEIITMASIVEKEAVTTEDRKRAAGILWKRMDNGMRLQSDVTINYILQKNTLVLNASDIATESAYNTYRNDGLPPTPIANPSLDSIMAALYPEDTEYWFFIATPDGEVLYSTTYEQHLNYRAQYYD